MRSFFRTLLRHRRPTSSPAPNQNKTTQSRAMSATSMAAAAAYACTISTPSALGPVPEDTEGKLHHAKDGKGFLNPWDSYKDWTPVTIAKAIFWKKISGKFPTPDTTPPTVTVIPPIFLPTRTSPTQTSLRATWLGHACYYVEFPSGLRVLFDPVFEPRCSPFSYMGPKRYTPPPCTLSDIPIIDLVIISHSHYDHLSHPSIMEIHKKHPNAHFLVGLGLKKWFHDCGIENVEEMDWWQDVDIRFSPKSENGGEKRISNISSTSPIQANPQPTTPESEPREENTNRDKEPGNGDPAEITARISCLPCQHTSARTAFDKGHTLWCSWGVSSSSSPSSSPSLSKSVWFGGDTGYRTVPDLPSTTDDYGPEFAHLPICPAFKQIGEFRGPFDLGLIPIGAYDPRSIMSPMHANPFDSVNIFLDTRCKRAMGIHWGTWVLTSEEVLEPPRLLKRALRWKGVEEEGVFDVCDIGESREF